MTGRTGTKHDRWGRAATAALTLVALLGMAGCGRVRERVESRVTSPTTPATETASPPQSTTSPGQTTTSPVIASTVTTAAPTTAPVTASASCGAGRPAAPGVAERSITVGGQARSYLVSIPPGYTGTAAVPVVYTFHGLGSNDRQQLAYSGFGKLGDQDGFIVVAPQAKGKVAEWDFLTPPRVPTSDAAFVEDLVRSVNATYCIDPNRQFATGISNGSAVVFALACSGLYPFAAYGGVAGAFFSDHCPAGPTPIIYFHGTADPLVPIDGGKTVGNADVKPAGQTMQAWADHDSCSSSPATSAVASDVTLHAWSGCADGTSVEYFVIAGGGHSWPGAVSVAGGLLGPTTHSISATTLMWSFFLAHPKP
jgi:polyhydroxybutyrate depolymerase